MNVTLAWEEIEAREECGGSVDIVAIMITNTLVWGFNGLRPLYVNKSMKFGIILEELSGI